jgi:3-hydroxymyristoyl/3-hydroxydecanoyl-(acyl carrier protein) dehydratase
MLEGPAADLFAQACREPLLDRAARQAGPVLERRDVERILPHRSPFLFVDRVTRFDDDEQVVVAQYDVTQAASILEGHFPGQPVWPGVLQVEAIGQAGLCLLLNQPRANLSGQRLRFAFTHILAARFALPVEPHGDVEVVARTISDGVFTIIVGQCLQDGEVCSAAAVQGIEREPVV